MIVCKNSICHYHKYDNTCSNSINDKSDPDLQEDYPNFQYDCYVCQSNGFRHFGCLDCDLDEDEYYDGMD